MRRRLVLVVALLALPSVAAAQNPPPLQIGSFIVPASAVNGAGVVTSPQLLAPDGTQAAPGIAYSADPGTGFRRSSAGVVRYVSAGTDQFSFQTNGIFALTNTNSALVFGSGSDVGLTRLGSGSMTIGNGAVGDFSGTLKLTTFQQAGKTTLYNNVTTAGWGVEAINGAATTGTVTNSGTASIATYTNGAADGVYRVSCDVSITVSTNHTFSCDVTYTDRSNTARTMILPMWSIAGAQLAGNLMTNAVGAGAFSSSVQQIGVKASTAITVRTSAGGTFTTVTYTAAGTITQVQ